MIAKAGTKIESWATLLFQLQVGITIFGGLFDEATQYPCFPYR